VDVAPTPVTMSVSVQPVTMAADYVTSATVRASFVAMAVKVTLDTPLDSVAVLRF